MQFSVKVDSQYYMSRLGGGGVLVFAVTLNSQHEQLKYPENSLVNYLKFRRNIFHF